MRRSEAGLWKKIRDMAKGDPGAHLIRVENPVYPGTPDVSYCIDGFEGWAELKVIPEWPARAGTIVRCNHFRREQRIWLRDRSRTGGTCYMLLRVEAEPDWLLIPGGRAWDKVGNLNRMETEALACAFWQGQTPGWGELRFALQRGKMIEDS